MKNYVIRKFRDKIGLFEVNEGVWTLRASTQKARGALLWLLRVAATLCVVLILAGLPSAVAMPAAETGEAQATTLWAFEVVTGFVGTGAEDDPNRPSVADDYALRKWEDVTGTPSAHITPAPNMYTIQAEATEAVLDAIEADNDYLVVWSGGIVEEEPGSQVIGILQAENGKNKDGVPPANEFGQLRAFLARNGVSQAQIRAVIGTEVRGRSRGELARLLREWFKTLPKAQG